MKLGKAEKMKTFRNTILAETWEERGETPDWNRLFGRRETYEPNRVPMAALFLAAGVDVQKDRLETSIWAWGPHKESWLIDHRVFYGDTTRAEVWDSLRELLDEEWPHAGGALMPLTRMAIDSGYATSEVYEFVRTARDQRVMAIKGVEGGAGMLIGTPTLVEVTRAGIKFKYGARVWPVYVSTLKMETFRLLNQDVPEDGAEYPAGYVHFNRLTTSDWFRQLCAEAISTRTTKGRSRMVWEKVQERNEALDCRVYARAAIAAFGLDRMNEHHFEIRRLELGIRNGVAGAVPPAHQLRGYAPPHRGRRVRSPGL
jgi:phage terminase large subunit GpA-like protein